MAWFIRATFNTEKRIYRKNKFWFGVWGAAALSFQVQEYYVRRLTRDENWDLIYIPF